MKTSLLIGSGVVVLGAGIVSAILSMNPPDNAVKTSHADSLIGTSPRKESLIPPVAEANSSQAQAGQDAPATQAPSTTPQTATPHTPRPPESVTTEFRTADTAKSSKPQAIWQISAESGPAPGSPASGQPGLAGNSGGIPVPTGARAPTAFYDNTERTDPQKRALARIQDRFLDSIANPEQGLTEEEIWARAKETADREYIKIFGFPQFEVLNRKTALDAIQEKQQAGTLPPPAVTRDE